MSCNGCDFEKSFFYYRPSMPHCEDVAAQSFQQCEESRQAEGLQDVEEAEVAPGDDVVMQNRNDY